MIHRLLVFLVSTSMAVPSFAQCPSKGSSVAFPDGSIAMRTGLAVNPDGAVQSYTVGDHGYTYMTNGLNLWVQGSQVGCSKPGNVARCRAAIRAAEAADFGPGSPELCVYAMEVEPYSAGAGTTSCGSGRRVAGNGKGKIRVGASVPTVAGGTIPTYVSTTSVRHLKGGSPAYLDSATVPVLVRPLNRPDLTGAIGWVRFQGRESFAIFGDAGPAFGEGSVALHQLLRSGVLSAQAVGPIPRELRCGAAETGLRPPFVVRPDIKNDLCRNGVARGAADIRAYGGIGGGVETVVLAKVKPPMRGSLVTAEVTPAMLERIARDSGYDRPRLAEMADCLTPVR